MSVSHPLAMFNDSLEAARDTQTGMAQRAAAVPLEPTRSLAEISDDDRGAESPSAQGRRARPAGYDGSTPASRASLAVSEADIRYWFG